MKAKAVSGVALVCLAVALVIAWQAVGGREAPVERTEAARQQVQGPAPAERETPPETNASSPARPPAHASQRPAPEVEPVDGRSPATMRVLVVAEEGVPCAGASVWLTDYSRGKKRVKRTTGAGGRVEIRDVAPGEHQLSVRSGKLQRITTIELTAGRATDVTVEMPRTGGVVEGVVRHRGTGPLADASITLSGGDGRFRAYLDGKAAAGGHYRIEAVPPGTYSIAVSSPTLGDRARGAGKVVVAGTGTVRRDIEVGSLSLHGVVRDADTRRPLPGVRVQMQEPVRRECITDVDGAYRFYDVSAGQSKIVLVKEGYELLFVDAGSFDGGEPRTRDILLLAAAALDIYVTDGEGPVSGALRLKLIDLGDPSAPTVTTGVKADAEGHAVYRKIRPGRYELSVRKGDARSQAQEFEVRAGTNTIHFRLQGDEPVPMLAGTVRDAATNQPAPGVSVHAMSLQKTVVTDERGEFEFPRLTSAEQTLYVSKDGYGFRLVRTGKLEKGRTHRVEIELGPGATLELTIRNPRGELPTEVTLLFRRRDAPWSEMWSAHIDVDENGRAAYRCVPPGKYRMIVVSRERSAAVDVDVPLGGASVEVRLR